MHYFIVSILAVWRITHLIARENGPFDVVLFLRRKAGRGFWGKLMDCFYCLSIWISLPAGWWLGGHWWEQVLYWLAVSGAACLLEKITEGNNIPFYKED
ncbi:DUF1360 domain-containing protein [Niabella beijingensis]|uniref:DUF1360 domain-containing protein n=1 Tax=Niabella beijingensis TaxID=2872700 RepID=UPI001CBC8F49|nr:DUF1360 domain-containing protein [Niabella beijingensis]MBZ4188694.1 DUF1360 domain-containing protein [Niabella beijingensis]